MIFDKKKDKQIRRQKNILFDFVFVCSKSLIKKVLQFFFFF